MKKIFIFIFLFKFIFASCPDGTIPSFNNPLICYQFNQNPIVFTEAEMTCQNRGGHLAAVTDGFTNTFLAQNANRTFTSDFPDFWVGGEDLDQKGKWVWTDGSAFTFQNWAPNEPDLLPGYQCISITKDRSFWFTTDCFDEKPYVCELPALILPTSSTLIPPKTTTTTSVPVDATTTPSSIDFTTTEEPTTTLGPPIYTCDGGWSQFNDTHFCFKIFPKNVFDDAEVACKSFGGHLASIHSTAELAFVNTLLENYLYWFGLCSTDNGMTWTWTDGTSTADFALDHWCGAGPDHRADISCVVYNYPSNKCFTNVRKNQNTNGLCKKPANVSYGSV